MDAQLLQFIVYLLLSSLVLWISMSLGKLMLSYMSDYQPITSLFSAENSTGFNAVYRILIVPVSVIVISILLFLLGGHQFVNNIWYISIIFFVIQTLLIIALGRWRLVNKVKYFIFHGISILLTFYIYSFAISKGIDYLLPDMDNFRSDMWLVVIIFMYGVFRSIPENTTEFNKRKSAYIHAKGSFFRHKYRIAFDQYDDFLVDVLVAIMVYENYNRPYLARQIEKIVSSKTKYIMQVANVTSDIESIENAAQNLAPLCEEFRNHTYPNEWQRDDKIRSIFSLHNPSDFLYPYRVKEVFDVIKTRGL